MKLSYTDVTRQVYENTWQRTALLQSRKVHQNVRGDSEIALQGPIRRIIEANLLFPMESLIQSKFKHYPKPWLNLNDL